MQKHRVNLPQKQNKPAHRKTNRLLQHLSMKGFKWYTGIKTVGIDWEALIFEAAR